TALPYIDTDRLSLLVLFGMESSARRPVEYNLIGSREITTSDRVQIEQLLIDETSGLPVEIQEYLSALHNRVCIADVGFRRRNMPALLGRFFRDMEAVLKNCFRILRAGGEAMLVIGDNRISLDGASERIATTDFVEAIANQAGFVPMERIDIAVT